MEPGIAFACRNRQVSDGRAMILATDLDGTFLAGSAEARQQLIKQFLHQDDAHLVYVTGRSAASVECLIESGRIPWPEFMICDVGTWISGPGGRGGASEAMQWIAERWQGKGPEIRKALAHLDGLELQPDFGPHRLGYFCSDPEVAQFAARLVEAMGCDALASDGRFFDVLPRGVNKGSSLQRLIDALGADPDQVLVAGDTLNDLAMLSAGFHAVAVGDSEPALLEQLPAGPRIHRAEAPGCNGILEAIAHFELFAAPMPV